MTAFTYLCKKANISVAHATITIYDKNNPALFPFLFNPADPNEPFARRIGLVEPVFEEYPEHKHYHDDGFSRDVLHFHMKFTKNIDEKMLAEFLTILLEKEIVNEVEKLGCMAAFHQASSKPIAAEFYDELHLLQLKAHEFQQKALNNPKKYQNAATTATNLYNILMENITQFTKNNSKSLKAYEHVTNNCSNAINEARTELEKHRGCKKLLINLSAAILGMGVFYLLALGINYYRTQGKELFFHCKTESAKQLEQLARKQEQILRI